MTLSVVLVVGGSALMLVGIMLESRMEWSGRLVVSFVGLLLLGTAVYEREKADVTRLRAEVATLEAALEEVAGEPPTRRLWFPHEGSYVAYLCTVERVMEGAPR